MWLSLFLSDWLDQPYFDFSDYLIWSICFGKTSSVTFIWGTGNIYIELPTIQYQHNSQKWMKKMCSMTTEDKIRTNLGLQKIALVLLLAACPPETSLYSTAFFFLSFSLERTRCYMFSTALWAECFFPPRALPLHTMCWKWKTLSVFEQWAFLFRTGFL